MSSLIVLNNSIIGMPTDELENLISWLKGRLDDDELDGKVSKQIIIVQRSGNNTLPTNGFRLIRCSREGITSD